MINPALIILISALLHAAWNTLLKHSKDKQSTSLVVLFIAGILSLLIALIQNVSWLALVQNALPWVMLAGLAEGFYFYFLAKALTSGALGPVYTTVRVGALLIVWSISLVFLGEHLSPLAIVGSLFILAGVPLLTSLKNGRKDSKTLTYALASAVFVAVYHLSYDEALKRGTHPSSLFSAAMFIACLTQVIFLRVSLKQGLALSFQNRSTALIVISASALCTGSFLLFLYGLSLSGPGFAIALRNTSILFTQIFAWSTGERLSRTQKLGVALSFLGAVLLSI